MNPAQDIEISGSKAEKSSAIRPQDELSNEEWDLHPENPRQWSMPRRLWQTFVAALPGIIVFVYPHNSKGIR
jgi:hypothetical protein